MELLACTHWIAERAGKDHVLFRGHWNFFSHWDIGLSFSHWDIACMHALDGGTCMQRIMCVWGNGISFSHWDIACMHALDGGRNVHAKHQVYFGHRNFFSHWDIGISFCHRVIARRQWTTDQASTGQGYFRETEFHYLSSIMFAQGGFLGPNELITTKPKPKSRNPNISHLAASLSESFQCPLLCSVKVLLPGFLHLL